MRTKAPFETTAPAKAMAERVKHHYSLNCRLSAQPSATSSVQHEEATKWTNRARQICLALALVALQLTICGCQVIKVQEVRLMSDQAKLAAVVVNPEYDYPSVNIAIRKLSDQKLLAEIAENQSAYEHYRCRVIEKLNDQIVLARIATNDPKPEIRREAILRLTDQQALADIAINDNGVSRLSSLDNGGNLATAAVFRLNDQALLARVAIEAPMKEALEFVNISSGPRRSGLGGEVDAMLATGSDVTILAPDGRTITNNPQYEYRPKPGFAANENAIAKLTDRSLLAKVQAEAKEPIVRAAAGRRLAELEAPSKQRP